MAGGCGTERAAAADFPETRSRALASTPTKKSSDRFDAQVGRQRARPRREPRRDQGAQSMRLDDEQDGLALAARGSSAPRAPRRASGPRTNRPVDRQSATVACAAKTVALPKSGAGRPLRGSSRCPTRTPPAVRRCAPNLPKSRVDPHAAIERQLEDRSASDRAGRRGEPRTAAFCRSRRAGRRSRARSPARAPAPAPRPVRRPAPPPCRSRPPPVAVRRAARARGAPDRARAGLHPTASRALSIPPRPGAARRCAAPRPRRAARRSGRTPRRSPASRRGPPSRRSRRAERARPAHRAGAALNVRSSLVARQVESRRSASSTAATIASLTARPVGRSGALDRHREAGAHRRDVALHELGPQRCERAPASSGAPERSEPRSH